MRKSAVVISTLSALLIAVVYNQIDKMTGVRLNTLLYISIATMIIGVCIELYLKKEES